MTKINIKIKNYTYFKNYKKYKIVFIFITSIEIYD